MFYIFIYINLELLNINKPLTHLLPSSLRQGSPHHAEFNLTNSRVGFHAGLGLELRKVCQCHQRRKRVKGACVITSPHQRVATGVGVLHLWQKFKVLKKAANKPVVGYNKKNSPETFKVREDSRHRPSNK